MIPNILKQTRYLYTLIITANMLKMMPQLKPSFDSIGKDLWKEGTPVELKPRVLVCTVKMITEKELPAKALESVCTTMVSDANRKYPGAEIVVDCTYQEVK